MNGRPSGEWVEKEISRVLEAHPESRGVWCQLYRGSGRFTGLTSNTPTFCENGTVAPDWVWCDWPEFHRMADEAEEENDRIMGR